jgi:hypothetical protein
MWKVPLFNPFDFVYIFVSFVSLFARTSYLTFGPFIKQVIK